MYLEHFSEFNLTPELYRAIERLGYSKPTPIQQSAFSKICSGRDLVGIAQTGTGKTMAYTLPLLRNLRKPTQNSPRILILVPTRELVLQVVESVNNLCTELSFKTIGVF